MALEYFKNPETIKIYSDSSYVVNTINNGWAKKWFEEQDFSKKNLDLWFKLIDLIDFHDVEFVWVKGHADNENNCMADMLAQHAANCLNLKTDICTSN
jgi:ribonuclease HI